MSENVKVDVKGQEAGEKVENGQKKVDRSPVKWVNIVSNEKYVREETPFRIYHCKQFSYRGTIEYLGTAEALESNKKVPSYVVILNSNGTKYGFNIPKTGRYLIIGELATVGDTVIISYLGQANELHLSDFCKLVGKNDWAYVLKIERVS